jgi:hypothetical protein
MDLGIVMRGEVLDDKRAAARAGLAVAMWNTGRVPTQLTGPPFRTSRGAFGDRVVGSAAISAAGLWPR